MTPAQIEVAARERADQIRGGRPWVARAESTGDLDIVMLLRMVEDLSSSLKELSSVVAALAETHNKPLVRTRYE